MDLDLEQYTRKIVRHTYLKFEIEKLQNEKSKIEKSLPKVIRDTLREDIKE